MDKLPTTTPVSFYEKLYRSLVSILIIFLIFYYAQNTLIPIAFAALFSLLLITPSKLLERFGIGRGMSALISTLLFIIAGFFVLYFISSQVIRFKADLPKLVDLFLAGFDALEAWITHKFNISTSSIDEFLHNATAKTLSNSSSLIGTTVGTLSGTLVYMILIPIYTFLLLYYRGLIAKFFIRVFPARHTTTVLDVLEKIRFVIKGYISGLIIEMVIVAALNITGFLILGVKYAILLGVIAAILNVIPYLGIFTACIISLLITSTTNTPGVVLGMAIVIVSVHLVDSNIILPKVVGSKVKINVLATLLAVLAGSAIWGIPGMFLSIPIIAILKIIFDAADELKPWGLLIGEEPKEKKPRKKPGLPAILQRRKRK
jgi:putative permease